MFASPTLTTHFKWRNHLYDRKGLLDRKINPFSSYSAGYIMFYTSVNYFWELAVMKCLIGIRLRGIVGQATATPLFKWCQKCMKIPHLHRQSFLGQILLRLKDFVVLFGCSERTFHISLIALCCIPWSQNHFPTQEYFKISKFTILQLFWSFVLLIFQGQVLRNWYVIAFVFRCLTKMFLISLIWNILSYIEAALENLHCDKSNGDYHDLKYSIAFS